MLVEYSSSSDSDVDASSSELRTTSSNLKRKSQSSTHTELPPSKRPSLTTTPSTTTTTTTTTTTPSSATTTTTSTSHALPPLPANFHDLYATTVRTSTSDDPSLHGGRKRGTPHVEGNWPTHVYLEWYPSVAEIETISKLASEVNEIEESCYEPEIERRPFLLNSLATSDLGVPQPLHVSLSCPLSLRTEQRDNFLEELRKSIDKIASLTPFTVRFQGIDSVSNETNNRYFLILRISKPENDALNHLLSASNSVAESHNSKPLYTKIQPRALPVHSKVNSVKVVAMDHTSDFHISVCSSLGKPPDSDWFALMCEDPDDTISKIYHKMRQFQIGFDSVKVKIGNTITSISLRRDEQGKEKGILGV